LKTQLLSKQEVMASPFYTQGVLISSASVPQIRSCFVVDDHTNSCLTYVWLMCANTPSKSWFFQPYARLGFPLWRRCAQLCFRVVFFCFFWEGGL